HYMGDILPGRLGAAIAALGMLAALPAAAQERPAVRPSHDATVIYHVQVAGPDGVSRSRTLHMYWTGQGTRLRMEVEGQPGFELIDFAADRMTMVMADKGSYLEVPFSPGNAPGLTIPPGVSLSRQGTDTVAGTQCTIWGMQGAQGGGTACITSDGLVLRVRGQKRDDPAAMEAISVVYAPQAAGLFAVPPGLKPLIPR
ncbi:MAG: hypothetical protein ACREF3_14430, partial [Acetobacteraceae bacterium]